jgi:hypothetical protein
MKFTYLIIFTAILITSCNKTYNWNCNCNIDGVLNDYAINEDTEEGANEKCNNRQAVFQASIGVTSASCALAKVE